MQKFLQLCEDGLGTTSKLWLRIEQELFNFEWLYNSVSSGWSAPVCKMKYEYLEELVDISFHPAKHLQIWKNKYLFKV